MIADRLRALAASWPNDNGDPPDTDYQSGYMAACAEHAQEVERILAEDAGGSEEPDCHAYSRNSRTSEGAALWMIAHTLRQIRDRLPSPPPQEPQP